MYFILAHSQNGTTEWVDDHSRHYSTGSEAADHARYMNERQVRYGNTLRYRVRKVLDTDSDNFITREAAKNHTPVPWKQGEYAAAQLYRMPHLDPADSTKVRFFRSTSDAAECRYTSMKMSRFLATYEDFEDEERMKILVDAGVYSGDTEFGITNDADLIVEIYSNGPTSCMADEDEYPLPDPHPAIVYSQGDLALAFVRNGSGFSARGVVYPEKKLWYSTYGHGTLLKKHLEELGYKEDNGRGYDGAKVGIFRDDDRIIMPYMDCCGYGNISSCGKFMVLDQHSGDYELRSTEGYAEPPYEDDDYDPDY